MAVEFKLPELRGTSEVTIGRWLKKAGDQIAAREKLLEVYSDRFDWDVPAPSDGTLAEIRANEGARVKVGDTLAMIDGVQPAAVSGQPSAVSPRVTPIAAKIAAEHNLDLSQVQGTGPGARVTKEDVLTHIAQQTPSLPLPRGTARSAYLAEVEGRVGVDTLVELSPAPRARIEQRTRSKQTIPQVTSFIEIDLRHAFARRDALQVSWQKREGFTLGHLPFIVLASVAALQAVPIVNSAFTPNGIARWKNVHLAVVNASQSSVLIAQADMYNWVGIARRLAQSQSHQPAQATFTIDARGESTGALLFTSSVMEGQAAALGLGAVQPRVVVVDEKVQIRPMLYASLTYDHRVVDGIVAGQFLSELKRQLEQMADGKWLMANGELLSAIRHPPSASCGMIRAEVLLWQSLRL